MTAQSVSTIATGPPLDEHETFEHICRRALSPSPVGPVGLELESHLVDLDHPSRRVPWDRITALLEELPTLPRRSRVTVEPGGQIELSGTVAGSPFAAIEAVRQDRAVLRTELARRRLGAAPLGADPARPPMRVHPGDRYAAMEQHYGATGRASAGRVMMCSTAALQVNLEAGPPSGWPARIALARRLGPVLVALSASSPLLNGARTGWQSSRQRVWSELDPHPPATAADPVSAWAQWAMDAPLMMIHSGRSNSRHSVRDRISLRAWATGSVRLDDRRPTPADVDYHLTTLFPPVRLRGYLEIRYLDAIPDPWWPALAAVTCLLLDDPRAARIAEAATEPVADAWTTAARCGLTDAPIRRAALRCLEAAGSVAPEPYRTDIGHYAELVAGGRTVAGELLRRADTAGPLAVLEEAAHA